MCAFLQIQIMLDKILNYALSVCLVFFTHVIDVFTM